MLNLAKQEIMKLKWKHEPKVSLSSSPRLSSSFPRNVNNMWKIVLFQMSGDEEKKQLTRATQNFNQTKILTGGSLWITSH